MNQNSSVERVDANLLAQINSLISLRKSKLNRLESIYIKGRSKVDSKQAGLEKGKLAHDRFRSQVEDTVRDLTDKYLGGDYRPNEIQKWFSEEKQLESEVVKSEAEQLERAKELENLKALNLEQKKTYQRAIISCEKIQILKEELLNEHS